MNTCDSSYIQAFQGNSIVKEKTLLIEKSLVYHVNKHNLHLYMYQ